MSMFLSKKRNRKASAGFSLIELMVSLTVFAIVMLVSTSTLLTMINANAKAQAMNSAMTNLSFALDNITREVRMGYHYYCDEQHNETEISPFNDFPNIEGTDADGNPIRVTKVHNCVKADHIAFIRGKDGSQIGYRLKNKVIQQKIDGEPWTPLTATEVFIDTFELTAQNTETYDENKSDINQPTVVLVIKGRVNNGLDTDTNFNVQTHIVQRRLDIL